MPAIRPLMTAGPMARASSPAKVFESISICAGAATGIAAMASPAAKRQRSL
jgi:hypothetical protein